MNPSPFLPLTFATDKAFDCLCFGRVGMDLYGAEQGSGLASLSGFRISLGGSPGNIAVGMARLGCHVACISKVATDPVGDYVVNTLTDEGVDTSCILRDAEGNLTSLALAAMQPENCEVVIYRQQAADLQLTTADIEAMPLGDTKVLLMSGTALSQAPSQQAALRAMEIARSHGAKVVLDLDYRANTWNSDAQAATIYGEALARSDLAIGNTEEWQVVDTGEVSALLNRYQQLAMLIHKQGSQGCVVHQRQAETIVNKRFSAYRVQSRKPYGAGDAFAAAVLQQLLTGESIDQAVLCGSASAALIVQADACALAMADIQAITRFIAEHSLQ